MADSVTLEVINGDEIMAQFKRLGRNISDALVEIVEAAGEIVLEAAQRDAPGDGAGVIMVVVGDGDFAAEADVGPDDAHWYYRFFESGTSPHEVRPIKRQALRFFGGGGAIFAQVTRPGGIPADPFLRPAIDENGENAAREAGRIIEAVMVAAVQ